MPATTKNIGSGNSTASCSSRLRISWLSLSAPARGITAPNRNAPKMKWTCIHSVVHADANSPISTSASRSGVSRPAFS